MEGTMIEIEFKFHGNILSTFLIICFMSYSSLVFPKPISLGHETHTFFVANPFFCEKHFWVDGTFTV